MGISTSYTPHWQDINLGHLAEQVKPVSVFKDPIELIEQIEIKRTANVSFRVADIVYNCSYQPDQQYIRIYFWAKLGRLPYSGENKKKRFELVQFLTNMPDLEFCRIGLDEKHDIILEANMIIEKLDPDDFVFRAFLQFHQEARPYLGVLARYI
jgi:hypothetical protein